MSATFSLGCLDCKEHIWCAQKGAGKGYVYGTDEYLEALSEFLFRHRGHRLKFEDNCEGGMVDEDWMEVGPAMSDPEYAEGRKQGEKE